MQKIGYAIVDATGNEVAFWGDTAGEERGVPDYIDWPNRDRTFCPEVGMQHEGCQFVERWLDQTAGGDASQSIKFDGNKVIVTRTVAAA